MNLAGSDENSGPAHSGLPLTVKFISLNVTDHFFQLLKTVHSQ